MEMQGAETVARWVSTPEAFSDVVAEMSERPSAVRTMFLTPEWLRNWVSVYRPRDARALAVWRGDRLAAALPLSTRRVAGILRTMEFAGAGALTPDHLDVLVHPDEAEAALPVLAAGLAGAAADWDMLELDKLDSGSATARALAEWFEARGFEVDLGGSAVCPCSDLPDTYDEYLRGLSRTTRGNLGQRLRKLQREHPGTRFEVAETDEDVDRALDALVALHQARWNERGHPGAFADARSVVFHRAVAHDALRAGTLRLRSLVADGSPIAVNYGYRVGVAVQSYQAGFDAAWAPYSPGMLLGAHCIEQSILEGAKVFDYLEGQESYKASWCDRQPADLRLRVFNRTPRGRLASWRCRSSAAGIRAARRWIPDAVRAEALRRVDRVRASVRRASAG